MPANGTVLGLRLGQDRVCSGCGESGEDAREIEGSAFVCLDCPEQPMLCQRCVEDGYGKGGMERIRQLFGLGHQADHVMRTHHAELDLHALNYSPIDCANCQTRFCDGAKYWCPECNYEVCGKCVENGRLHYRDEKFPNCGATKDTTTEGHYFIIFEPEDRVIWTENEFRATSAKIHQKFALTIGQRQHDVVDFSDEKSLNRFGRKIGYALFGEPTCAMTVEERTKMADEKLFVDLSKGSADLSSYGYEKSQEVHIQSLIEQCQYIHKYNGPINDTKMKVNFIFIMAHANGRIAMVPLIRLLAPNQQLFFVEPFGRTYTGWEDFLANNRLSSEWTLCVPLGGWYTVTEKHGYPDMAMIARRVQRVVDTVNHAAYLLGVGATLASVASLASPVGAAAASATFMSGMTAGMWGAGQSALNILDRIQHGESVAPYNGFNMFATWLSLISAPLALTSAAGASYITHAHEAGHHLSPATIATIDLAIYGNKGVSAAGTLITGYSMAEWVYRKEHSSALAFASALLFFYDHLSEEGLGLPENLITESVTDIAPVPPS